MARGILITYPGYPYTMSSLMPDNGLANLAGALFAAGHEALVVDYGTVDTIRRLYPESVTNALRASMESKPDLHFLDRELEAHAEQELARFGEELCELVRSYRPDFVGFKLWNGDGCLGSLALARTLRREFPRLCLFAGGPQVTYAIEPVIAASGHFDALDDGTFDAIVQSEAEEVMSALAEYATGKRALETIPNAIYRGAEGIQVNPVERAGSLDALAAPIYDSEIYPSMQGDQKLHMLTLDESRGCPFRCAFCIQPVISGHRLRERAANRIVDEMERCVRQYRISAFRFAGSSSPGRLLSEIADEVLARGLRVRYTAFGRVNFTRLGDLPRMRESGLQGLFFGVESGSQRILDESMNKMVKVEDMRRVLKASREAGIFTVGSIIAPAPGETAETLQETLDFLADVRPDGVPICPPGPVPGTAWFIEREKYGVWLGDRVLQELLGFKFKLLFPADQWEYPEYSVDGKDTRQMARECAGMVRRVEQLGILSMFSDDMYLMTRYCGMAPREFRDLTQRWLCAGDWQSVAGLVAKMNANIHAEARQALA